MLTGRRYLLLSLVLLIGIGSNWRLELVRGGLGRLIVLVVWVVRVVLARAEGVVLVHVDDGLAQKTRAKILSSRASSGLVRHAEGDGGVCRVGVAEVLSRETGTDQAEQLV